MCAEVTGIMDFCNVYKLHLSIIDMIVPESISCISIGRLEWVAFGLAGLTIAFLDVSKLGWVQIGGDPLGFFNPLLMLLNSSPKRTSYHSWQTDLYSISRL